LQWAPAPAGEFAVRGPNYLKDKKKQPSLPSVYAPEGVLGVTSREGKITRAEIFEQLEKQGRLRAFGEGESADGVPELLVINCQVPFEEPSMFRGPSSDDPGWSAVTFLRLQRAAPGDEGEAKARALLNRFLGYGEISNDSKQDYVPLKLIGMVPTDEDWKKLGLPSSMMRWNGKPVLLRKNELKVERRGNAAVVDFDLRKWSYVPRKALHSVMSDAEKSSQITYRVGLLLEAREEATLPERLLGSVDVFGVDNTKLPVVGLSGGSGSRPSSASTEDTEESDAGSDSGEETEGEGKKKSRIGRFFGRK